MSINRRLLYLAIGVGCFAVATASLRYANAWVVSVIVTLSIGCWLTGLLWAIYTPKDRRVLALGALVCSFLYFLLSGGPWFRDHVGPWLLTTRALVAMDTYVLGHEQPAAVNQPVPMSVPWAYTNSGRGGYITMAPTATIWPTQPSPIVESPISASVVVGQWLFAWCAAALGGWAAVWIARRSARNETQPREAAP